MANLDFLPSALRLLALKHAYSECKLFQIYLMTESCWVINLIGMIKVSRLLGEICTYMILFLFIHSRVLLQTFLAMHKNVMLAVYINLWHCHLMDLTLYYFDFRTFRCISTKLCIAFWRTNVLQSLAPIYLPGS